MSTNLSPFVVYAPYRTETEVVERRKSLRNEHVAGIAKLRESGTLQQVIMHLKPNAEEGTDPQELLMGATLILRTTTYLEAEKIIWSDVYWKEDIWSKEQLVINPALIL